MIIVKFTSGLGNQMFQYNLYSFLKEKYPGTQVKADTTWFNILDEHHGFELKRIFGNVEGSAFSFEEASIGEIYRASGQIPTPVKGTLGKAIRPFFGHINRRLREAGKIEKNGVTLDYFEAKPEYETICDLDVSRNHYIFGFFIEEAFYKDRVEKIKKELVFPPMSGKCAELAQKMEQEDSVSIHVRRGDYLSSTYSGKFLSLGMDYYDKAVEIIREHIANPKFYIFSEDAGYVKKAFEKLPDKTIVTINSGADSFRDMQLMTKCKANIIANSTFSQWGSILNDNPGHITVYPAKYMADEDTEVHSMPGWIRV
jgi:hypothetical protein